MERVSGKELEPYIERVEPELGATNQRRLRAFLDVKAEPDGGYAFSKVFAALYPGLGKQKALESFRKFRPDLNRAADEANCPFRIVSDNSKTPRLEDRRCWFEGDPIDHPELEEFAEDSSRLNEGEALGKSFGITSDSNPDYMVFVSYAQKNGSLVSGLLDGLETRLRVLSEPKPYQVSLWRDGNIEPGERWRQSILDAIQRCRLGLLFLSPDFLASAFIEEHELPAFASGVDDLDSNKPCIPVMLEAFPIPTYKEPLGPLAEKQIYRYEHRKNGKRYAWNTCRQQPIKNAFLDDLADRLLKRLDRIHKMRATSLPATGSGTLVESGIDPLCVPDAYASDASQHDERIKGEQRSHAQTSTLSELNRLGAEEDVKSSGNSVVAVDFLRAWALKKPDPSYDFLAVLGEFGMGKTTTLKQFAQALAEDRLADPKLPLPLFFDLRAYQRTRRAEQPIVLEAVIASCIHGVKTADGTRWKLAPADLLQAIRTRGAIAIFDGLDEVMTTMTSPERQEFVRELCSALPLLPKEFKDSDLRGRGKIVMSCRSHFFRDVTEQNGFYTGQSREGVSEEDRRSLILLPFSEEQIIDYLKANLGAKRGATVYALLKDIHNVLDLAERPVLLNMIREIIPELERSIMVGAEIQGVDLYEQFIKKHFDRDEGKHVFTTEHKIRLMEALAADLWISGERSWTWSRLAQWLDVFLAEHPAISSRYHVNPEVLNQDFRNATAVVRPAGEKTDFCFAHTSLQEYFLACWMQRSLEADEIGRWGQMPIPSDATLDFLGQLLSKGGARGKTALRRLSALMEAAQGESALIGFRYLLLAKRRGFSLPRPEHIDLGGASLLGWKLHGRNETEPLVLKGANFAGANLSLTEWRWVILQSACFADTTLNQSRWKDCRILDSRFGGSKADGARFRSCRWQDPVFEAADSWAGAWLVECVGFLTPDKAPFALNVADGEIFAAISDLNRHCHGHSSGVLSVAVDAARGRYVTGSSDGTARVWDAESLELCGELPCGSSVSSVAVDEARGRYVTGSDDGTARVWDAESLELCGELPCGSGILSVAVDEARGRYVTGSYDGAARVWDAESLELCGELPCGSWVLSVAVDATRGRYVTGSYDGGARVWDARNLELCGELPCRSALRSVAIDAARGRYVTGSYDGGARVWDAESLELCVELPCGSGVLSGADDAARGRYVTGSLDGTARVWDARNLELCGELPCGSRVLSVAVDAARDRYVTGSSDGAARLWEAENFELCGELPCGFDVMTVTVDAARDRYVTGSDDGAARVWEARNLELCGELPCGSWVLSVAVDAARDRYVTGSDEGAARVWEARSLELCGELPCGSWVLSVAVDAARGRYVTGSDDGVARVWDAGSLELCGELPCDSRVLTVAVDAVHGRYVTGSYDGAARVWNARNLELCGELPCGSRVLSVAVDAARSRYVTGSLDGTVRLWDAQSLELKARMWSLPESQWAVAGPIGKSPLALSYRANEHLMWIVQDPTSQRSKPVPYEAVDVSRL